MPGGQKPRPPEMALQRLAPLALRDQHHERGQVVGLTAEAIVEPGTNAWPARNLRAALHEGDTGPVVDALGEHRLDEAETVGHASGVRQQFADPGSTFAVLGKLKGGADQRDRTLVARHAGQPLAAPHTIRQLLSGLLK